MGDPGGVIILKYILKGHNTSIYLSGNRFWQWEVDGPDSGSCTRVGFDLSSFYSSSSFPCTTRTYLLNTQTACFEYISGQYPWDYTNTFKFPRP